jgi:site-specific DNA-methyltransferase (adenine-specific)
MFSSEADRDAAAPTSLPNARVSFSDSDNGNGGTFKQRDRRGEDPRGHQSDLGRWPANVLLDEDAAEALDEQTGELTSGASRFYYVAKPSREERDYGTAGLIAKQRDETRKEGTPGGDNPRNRGLQPRGNFHPTVKPVELMRWLVKLVTPIKGIVLDPFMGSGTTGMACRYELRRFIGIEREPEYLAIAERRIAAVAPLFSEVSA